MNMLHKLITAVFLLMIFTQGYAANYYVGASATGDKSGKDINNLMTLSAANSALQPGDTAYLLDSRGDFKTTIAPVRSGTSEGMRIRYVAYNGHKPTINMGSRLSGWTKYSGTDGVDAIYRKQVSENPRLLIIDTIEQKGVKSMLWHVSHPNPGISGQCGATDCITRSRQACYDNSCMRAGDSRWGDDGYLYVRTYENDDPSNHTITGIFGSNGISLTNINYVTINGITVKYVKKFADLVNTKYITFEDNHFQYGVGYGNLDVFDSSYIVIRNNIIRGAGSIQGHTGDAISLRSSNHLLVENNDISFTAHQAITVRDCKYSIVRKNHIYKSYGKNIQVFGKGNSLTNVVEFNRSTGSPNAESIKDWHYGDHAGTAIGGSHTIVRFNEYWNNSVAINFSTSHGSADYISPDHRVYHNVAYGSRPTKGAVNGSGVMFYLTQHKDPVVVNNIFSENKGGDQYGPANDGQIGIWLPEYISIINPKIENNLLWTSGNLGEVFYKNSVSGFESKYPGVAKNNIAQNPLFVGYNDINPDFKLRSDSPAIDRGRFLTTTNGAYSGNTVKVLDSRFFIDGFGIVSGDKIKIGANPLVTITSVNYDTHMITHNGNISGNGNEGVSFNYTGSAPDIGAYELGLDGGSSVALSPPSPPTNITFQIVQ